MLPKDNRTTRLIRKWFSTMSGGSMHLPDKWFGRPFDSIHQLTYLEQRPHRLLMELDQQLLLTFTGDVTAEVEASDLVIGNFQQFVFDWLSYGDLVPHCDVFHTGTVRFVSVIIRPTRNHRL